MRWGVDIVIGHSRGSGIVTRKGPLVQEALKLVVHDDGQEGRMNREAVGVIFDEAKLPELIQEEVHAGPRRPDHFGEGLLRYRRYQP